MPTKKKTNKKNTKNSKKAVKKKATKAKDTSSLSWAEIVDEIFVKIKEAHKVGDIETLGRLEDLFDWLEESVVNDPSCGKSAVMSKMIAQLDGTYVGSEDYQFLEDLLSDLEESTEAHAVLSAVLRNDFWPGMENELAGHFLAELGYDWEFAADCRQAVINVIQEYEDQD